MKMLPVFVITWLLFLIFRTVLIIVGAVAILPMALFWRKTTKLTQSMVNGREIMNWRFGFMYLWSNDEDGVLAGEEFPGYPIWWRIYYWSAIRNPVNNLRFLRGLSCRLVPLKIKYVASLVTMIDGHKVAVVNPNIYDEDRFRFSTLTFQGCYSNLRIQFKMFNSIWRFWIGWKIYPHDSLGIDTNDYRRFGAGFATQFKRIYPRK